MEFPPAKKAKLSERAVEHLLRDLDARESKDASLFDTGFAVGPFNTAHRRHLSKPKLGFSVDYYPNFFRRRDADAIFQHLDHQLQPYLDSSKSEIRIMGKVCSIPRQQTAFGEVGLTYSFSGTTVPANPWTPLMCDVKERVEGATGEHFNFVLVNRYKDGSDHIGEHRDDERDLCERAPIASLSFGQARDFVFKHREARGRDARRKDIQPVKIELEHGSLLVMKYPTNREWYHSLPVRKNAPSPRINLTFRKMRAEGFGGQGSRSLEGLEEGAGIKKSLTV